MIVSWLRDHLADDPKAGDDTTSPSGTVHMHGSKQVMANLGFGVHVPIQDVGIEYVDGKFVAIISVGQKCSDCDGSGVGEWMDSMTMVGVPGGMMPSAPCGACDGYGHFVPEVLGERTLVPTDELQRLRHEHEQMRNILETRAEEMHRP